MNSPTPRIKGINFSVFEPEQIKKFSNVEIRCKDIYDINKLPKPEGPLDENLGNTNSSQKCIVCKESDMCSGHFGHINLIFPVFHPGFFNHVYNILHCVCQKCGHLLLDDSCSNNFVRSNNKSTNNDSKKDQSMKKITKSQTSKSNISSESKDFLKIEYKLPSTVLFKSYEFKKIVEESKKIKICTNCNSINDIIKRSSGYKMQTVNKKMDLTPLAVYNIFSLVSQTHYKYLRITGSPCNLLITILPVPPNHIRPSVTMHNTSNEDDLTIKIAEIIHTNEIIKNGMENGVDYHVIQEDWDFLQSQVSLFINSETPYNSKTDSRLRPIRGLVQRLKGKHGRFRGNLSGKRVDYTGRTVISPDPYLSVEEVGVPQILAQTLTIFENVTSFNIVKLKKHVVNGPNYPGANFVSNETNKVFLKYANRKRVAENLKIGDVVERHLIDGDIVLFNRQPSLHRVSIMAHRIRIHKFKTLRFNECVCTPYNADFDGDEMNIHIPQTIEAIAEAKELMAVKKNLLTPRNGEPIIACTQDFITAMFLLTNKECFFQDIGNILGSFMRKIKGVRPCITRPHRLWTGKQVFNILINTSIENGVEKWDGLTNLPYNTNHLNMFSKNRSYKESHDYAIDDTTVIIRNNYLFFGQIDKSNIGTENKNTSIIYKLIQIHNKCAVEFMNNISRLSSFFLSEYGFSIGLDDVEAEDTYNKSPSQLEMNKLSNKKDEIVKKIYIQCFETIKAYSEGELEAMPGCTPLETLESIMSSQLNKIREECGNACMEALSRHNTPFIMQACGSKGSKINVAQMVACVGQQIVSGKRITDGISCNYTENIKDFANEDINNNEITLNKNNTKEKEVNSNKNNPEIVHTHVDPNTIFCDENMINKTSQSITKTSPNEQNLGINLSIHNNMFDFRKNISNSRTLPHFHSGNSLSPIAKGFVCNSFFSGLKPAEFFFHAVSGREGLVDTAVKTAETGYMQRRLMKAMEDLKIDYDHSIRNSSNEVLVFDVLNDNSNSPNIYKFNYSVQTQNKPIRETERSFKTQENIFLSMQESNIIINDVKAKLKQTQNIQFSRTSKNNANKHYKNECKYKAKQDIFKFKNENIVFENYGDLNEPGTAIGAIAGQSIGEPGTQMTLKTFHFAGVASMNITLGVPRLKEIINAVKFISTPIIKAEFDVKRKFYSLNKLFNTSKQMKFCKMLDYAHYVARMIEKTYLKDIADSVHEIITPCEKFLAVELSLKTINDLKLLINIEEIKLAIHKEHKIPLVQISTESNKIYILCENDYFSYKNLKRKILETFVSGIKTVQRCVVNSERKKVDIDIQKNKESTAIKVNNTTRSSQENVYLDDFVSSVQKKNEGNPIEVLDVKLNSLIEPGDNKNESIDVNIEDSEDEIINLIIEGTGLNEILGTEGIKTATSNNVVEIYETLGVEAARTSIVNEILYTMESYGISIFRRHVELLADTMTNKGSVLGITRQGISKMKINTLMLASFEQTSEHLFDAAIKGKCDKVHGVSESIIMGQNMNIGTGMVNILWKRNADEKQ